MRCTLRTLRTHAGSFILRHSQSVCSQLSHTFLLTGSICHTASLLFKSVAVRISYHYWPLMLF